MFALPVRILIAATIGAALASADDAERQAQPPPPPSPALPTGAVLFSDDFSGGDLGRWEPDRQGVWTVRRGMLRADLPDERQVRSFLYAGSPDWRDVAVDLDVCAMRGVDKGVALRVNGGTGIGVDLRGPGYQDVLLHRRERSLGKARALNANGVWNHLRLEAVGTHYRVYVNGRLAIDREHAKGGAHPGRIALAAYTGGVGQCTVWYDNVVVTALDTLATVGVK